jgi:hypothetical protein
MTSGIIWLIAGAGVALIAIDALLYLVLRIRAVVAASGPRRAVSDAAKSLTASAQPLLADESVPATTRGAIEGLLARSSDLEQAAARGEAAAVPLDSAVQPQGVKGWASRFPLILAGIALVVLGALLGGLNFSFGL